MRNFSDGECLESRVEGWKRVRSIQLAQAVCFRTVPRNDLVSRSRYDRFHHTTTTIRKAASLRRGDGHQSIASAVRRVSSPLPGGFKFIS